MHPPTFSIARLGRVIAERRVELGLSQQALAERLGHHSSETISRYERGEREPRVSTLVRLASALETDPQTLLRWCAPGEPDSIDMARALDAHPGEPKVEGSAFQVTSDQLERALRAGLEVALAEVTGASLVDARQREPQS